MILKLTLTRLLSHKQRIIWCCSSYTCSVIYKSSQHTKRTLMYFFSCEIYILNQVQDECI